MTAADAGELASLERETEILRAGITKASARLENLRNRCESLIHMVGKQAEQLQRLRQQSEVVSLAAYREMKVKHRQHRDTLVQVKSSIAGIETELKDRKLNLTQMESRLKMLRAEQEGMGKLIPLRKTAS